MCGMLTWIYRTSGRHRDPTAGARPKPIAEPPQTCVSLGNKRFIAGSTIAPPRWAPQSRSTRCSRLTHARPPRPVAGFVFERRLVRRPCQTGRNCSVGAVQAMLRSAQHQFGIIATAVGIGTLIVTATAVFSELQAALNLIWKVPGEWGPRRIVLSQVALSQPLGFLAIGFLLLVSLVMTRRLLHLQWSISNWHKALRLSFHPCTQRSHSALLPCFLQ